VIRFGSNGIPQVTTTTLEGVAHGFRCVMADATGDGVDDAFVIAPDVVTVIPGQRSGAFEPERKEVLDAVDHGAVAVGDLDQDGRPDVATVQFVLTPAFWQQPSTVVRLYLTGEP